MIFLLNGPLIAQTDASGLMGLIANSVYIILALVALWGAFCVVMVWQRVARQRFKNEDEQSEFLDEIQPRLEAGQFDEVLEICDGDPRVVPQLTQVAVNNRNIGYAKIKHLLADRFQRDIRSELEQRLGWVNTVIKAAPMIGLFGTVFGMMGAFEKLSSSTTVKADALAGDIFVALITTASGLAIAIPLILLTQSINIRIRKMDDLVASGVGRVLDTLRDSIN